MLTAGLTIAETSRRTGINTQVLARHRRNGHIAVRSGAGVPKGSPEDGADHVAILRETLNALRAMDTTRLSPIALVARLNAIRQASESLGKIEPSAPLPDQPLESREDYQTLMRTFMTVLEPLPAVRELLADAFHAANGEPLEGVLDRSVLNTVAALAKADGVNPTLADSLKGFVENFYLAHNARLMAAMVAGQ